MIPDSCLDTEQFPFAQRKAPENPCRLDGARFRMVFFAPAYIMQESRHLAQDHESFYMLWIQMAWLQFDENKGCSLHTDSCAVKKPMAEIIVKTRFYALTKSLYQVIAEKEPPGKGECRPESGIELRQCMSCGDSFCFPLQSPDGFVHPVPVP